MSVPICGNCGTHINTGIRVEYDFEYKYFCDESCERKHTRDTTKSTLENKCESSKEYINKLGEWMKELGIMTPFAKIYKKVWMANYIFYKSVLERKPRDELNRLFLLLKMTLTEACEAAHENKQDSLLFKFGEWFKLDETDIIDAWCAPEVVRS